MIPFSIEQVDPDYFLYVGTLGVLLAFLFLLLFLIRRINWIVRVIARRKRTTPKLLASLRNLLMIVLLISLFGMILSMGAFMQAYSAFTSEEPVAEIRVQPLDMRGEAPGAVIHLTMDHSGETRHFFIQGDQWMLEGDLLRWDNWLNFLGLRSRYRLTRLQGRYVSTKAELNESRSLFSLVEKEDHPLWRYLYQYGHELPFVSTVYGSAAFQNSGEEKRYLVYVATSGFVVRQK